MSKLSVFLPILAPAFVLLACTEQVVEQAAQPSGELFHFYTEGIETRASYRCETGANYPVTKARAEKAHALVMERLETAPKSNGVATLATMQLAASEVQADMNSRLRCFAEFEG